MTTLNEKFAIGTIIIANSNLYWDCENECYSTTEVDDCQSDEWTSIEKGQKFEITEHYEFDNEYDASGNDMVVTLTRDEIEQHFNKSTSSTKYTMYNASSYGNKSYKKVILSSATIDEVKSKYLDMCGWYMSEIFDREFLKNKNNFSMPNGYNTIFIKSL